MGSRKPGWSRCHLPASSLGRRRTPQDSRRGPDPGVRAGGVRHACRRWSDGGGDVYVGTSMSYQTMTAPRWLVTQTAIVFLYFPGKGVFVATAVRRSDAMLRWSGWLAWAAAALVAVSSLAVFSGTGPLRSTRPVAGPARLRVCGAGGPGVRRYPARATHSADSAGTCCLLGLLTLEVEVISRRSGGPSCSIASHRDGLCLPRLSPRWGRISLVSSLAASPPRPAQRRVHISAQAAAAGPLPSDPRCPFEGTPRGRQRAAWPATLPNSHAIATV